MQKTRSVKKTAKKKSAREQIFKSTAGPQPPGSPWFRKVRPSSTRDVRRLWKRSVGSTPGRHNRGICPAQQPAEAAPLTDYVFTDRKAEYGFRYLDHGRGRKKFWYPEPNRVLSLGYEPEYHEDDDTVFVIAERIEFLPGQ